MLKSRRYAQAYSYCDLFGPPRIVTTVVLSKSIEDVSENVRANLEYIDRRFGAARSSLPTT